MGMRMNGHKAALATLAPFAGCTAKELALVDSLASRVRVPAGTVLTREGARDRQCFVVEQGAVEVASHGETIYVSGRGEWVGELALLGGGRRRCATATTLTETDLLVFDPGAFAAVVAEVPWAADHVRMVAGERREALAGADQRATTAPQRGAVPVLRLA
ncbi:MAG TPA: cyclic nucleotide-binding domain-containing protein [Acidimicrobiales bacterium]|nr:cyclic nucleotide-binding domain-containing protein [Acidimicrobiales bacterium]